MFFPFMALAVVIILPGAVYFLIHFKNLSFIRNFSRYSWFPWAIATLLTLICAYMVHFVFSLSAAIILFIFFSFIITDLTNLFFKRYIKKERALKVWTSLYRSGISALAVTALFIGISYYVALNVVTTNYNLNTNKTLSSQPLKISMVSDIHLGTAVTIDNLKKYCDKIQASNPDIVVLTGDIFDENTPKGNMEAACKMLGQIKSTYGIYYVFGNHEQGIHGNIPYFTINDVAANLAANKIIVLEDKPELVNSKFYIVGRKDASLSHNANRKPLKELLQGVDKSKFILLLDHQPLDFENASQNGVDLQLSAHTHGGQIWPTGMLTDIFNPAGLNYGYKSIGNYQVIVSSGMGAWNYPLRLGSKAEIVQISVQGRTP